MKKIFTIIATIILGLSSIHAQVEVSIGASYSNQAYYALSDDATTTLANDSWDLAFSLGFSEAGILYNESADYGGPSLKMYLLPTNDFSDSFNPNDLTDSLYNAQDNWQNGAFNVARDVNDAYDMGWGTYDPTTHAINGTRVFAIKMRDDSWKKIKIVSLSMGTYTIKYADPDGANEVITTITKSEFTDSPFAYFSFNDGTATASPLGWDLFFGRYVTPLSAGSSIVPYTVAGVLAAPGVQVAQANEIDPFNVDYNDFLDSLSEQIDVIGHDWKNIDFTSSPPAWVIYDDRAYFVKTTDGHLWKLVFLDFEGSSTGVSVFEKTDFGVVTAIKNPTSNYTEFGVYPNPIIDDFTVSFSLKKSRENMNVIIIDNSGQIIWTAKTNGQAGLNVMELQAPTVPTGTYQLILRSDSEMMTKTLLFK